MQDLQVPAGAEEVTPRSDPHLDNSLDNSLTPVQEEGMGEGNLLSFEGFLHEQTVDSDPEKSLIPPPGAASRALLARHAPASTDPDKLTTNAALTQGCSADNIKT